jgi:hypothetical protein
VVDDFASRVAAAADEMRRKAIEREFHTETRAELPEEVKTLLLEMAGEINHLKKEVFDLKATVGAFGSVTLNDLMKKSA